MKGDSVSWEETQEERERDLKWDQEVKDSMKEIRETKSVIAMQFFFFFILEYHIFLGRDIYFAIARQLMVLWSVVWF